MLGNDTNKHATIMNTAAMLDNGEKQRWKKYSYANVSTVLTWRMHLGILSIWNSFGIQYNKQLPFHVGDIL